MRRRFAQWLTLVVLCVGATPACGNGFGPADILGIWNTASINGYLVPGTVVYEGVSYDTEYVRWAFYDGGQCLLTQRVDGVTDTFDECEYLVNAEQETITIVLLFEAWLGSLDGDSMVLVDPQDIGWVLRRQ